MKTIYSKVLALSISLFTTLSVVSGQINPDNPPTNPKPIILTENGYSQDFNGMGTDYPEGWNGWLVKVSAQAGAYPKNNPRLEHPYSNTPDAIQKGTAASKGNFIFNFGDKLGFKNGGYSDYAIVTALNTASLTNDKKIKIAFDAMIMRNLYEAKEGMNLICALALQYRVGTDGKFVNLADEIVKNGKNQNIRGTNPCEINKFTIDLPKECYGQEVVQFRWIMKYISGSIDDVNNRPSFAIDNFVVEVK